MSSVWKHEILFWFDRKPSDAERQLYGEKCPEKIKHIMQLRLRADGTMWYASCELRDLTPENAEKYIEFKLKNADQTLEFASENSEAQEPVTDTEFKKGCEDNRSELDGHYFTRDDMASIYAAFE